MRSNQELRGSRGPEWMQGKGEGGFREGDAAGWVGGQDRGSQTAVSSWGEERS